MKQIRVSPFNLGAHEFYRAARSLQKTRSAEEIFATISDRKRELLAKIGKQLSMIVILFLVLSINQSNISVDINTSFAKISIPKLYFVFFVSTFSGVMVLELIGYFNLNEYQRIVSSKMLKFDNAQVRSLFYDGSASWNHLLNLNYRFLDGGVAYRRFVILSALFLIIPIVIVFFMVYLYVTEFLIDYLQGYNYIWFGDILAIVSLMMLFFPLVVAGVVYTPAPYLKHKRFIRWNFLFRLHRKSNVFPQQATSWLNDQTPNGDG